MFEINIYFGKAITPSYQIPYNNIIMVFFFKFHYMWLSRKAFQIRIAHYNKVYISRLHSKFSIRWSIFEKNCVMLCSSLKECIVSSRYESELICQMTFRLDIQFHLNLSSNFSDTSETKRRLGSLSCYFHEFCATNNA